MTTVRVYSTTFGRSMLWDGERLWLTTSARPDPHSFPSAQAAEDAIADTMAAHREERARGLGGGSGASEWTERRAYTLEDPRLRRSKAT